MQSFAHYVLLREAEVSTDDIGRQIFQTAIHLLPGKWTIYREEPPKLIKVGRILLLGKDVFENQDQYLLAASWTLYDDDIKIGGSFNDDIPKTYDSRHGGARVSFDFGIQAYSPEDRGALGGMIKVEGKPMTPIAQENGAFRTSAETPFDVVKKAHEMMEQYHLKHYRMIPGGVQISQDYYSQS